MKLHLVEFNSTHSPGGGHATEAPLEFESPARNVGASGANGARPTAEPLHSVLPNATENPEHLHQPPLSPYQISR